MKTRKSKYFNAQTEDKSRPCDHPGCKGKGEYRAPKSRDLDEYYWFCLKHVREYNKNWNYYSGTDEYDIEDVIKSDNAWQQKNRRFSINPAYYKAYLRAKDNFGFFDGSEELKDGPQTKINYTPEVAKAMRVMGIKKLSTIDALKKRYKALVKKYHPDVNGGNKEMEEKFKNIGQAYKVLLKIYELS